MAVITREPAKASQRAYDMIIIGGGIYGVMLSYEASLGGLKTLMLERGDFGEHTSFNSLRIIHGGLRYLQSLDLHRFRESVGERSWFLNSFPDLVKPLPCLMPLYGNGLRHPLALGLALRVNDVLSRSRGFGASGDHPLPMGQIVDAGRTKAIFPGVDTRKLKGGAIWYDAYMPNSQRLLITALGWACELGATALNYVEACHLVKHKEKVLGVIAADRENGETFEYSAPTVVNAAGPWCADVAVRLDRDVPGLFQPSLAWNILFNRDPLSDHALAVAPGTLNGQTYFLAPWHGKLLAGTGHASWNNEVTERPRPSGDQIHDFVKDLNLAVPGLNLGLDDIVHVFSGLLPVTKRGTRKLAVREVIIEHAGHGGPHGLYSVSGVKFTTSRLVAQKTLCSIMFGGVGGYKIKTRPVQPGIRFPRKDCEVLDPDTELVRGPSASLQKTLREIIAEESTLHLDDLVMRRTMLWSDPLGALRISSQLCSLFGWDEVRSRQEVERLKRRLRG